MSLFRMSATDVVSTWLTSFGKMTPPLSWRYCNISLDFRTSRFPTTLPKYPAVLQFSGAGLSRRDMRSFIRSASSSKVLNTASTSQQKTSHAVNGYLYVLLGSSLSAGGGSTRYRTNCSTVLLSLKKATSRPLRDLHSCIMSSSSRSSSRVNSSLSRICSIGEGWEKPATFQNIPASVTDCDALALLYHSAMRVYFLSPGTLNIAINSMKQQRCNRSPGNDGCT
mmetsp:Transcript_14021/g.30340  ORF Transcript_14021/g.30340 Transcript_14021/m.30340 type:complete len:224 (+) Transcript_14021:2769-3440(+)